MAKNISDIFDVYYNSGLHGASWQSTTICICKIMYEREENKNVQFVLKENARTGHAEALLLDHLEILESQGIKPKHLCLYINYSPCYQCSLRLCEYLERHPTVGIEIVFCQLYYVQRHSCQQRCPGRICSQSGSEEIETGLYNLKVNNVSLRPFNWEDWKHLIKILYHLKETNPSEYEGEILLDEGLYKMFFYGWGYLNNRENEDRLLMDDWGELDSKFQSTSLGKCLKLGYLLTQSFVWPIFTKFINYLIINHYLLCLPKYPKI